LWGVWYARVYGPSFFVKFSAGDYLGGDSQSPLGDLARLLFWLNRKGNVGGLHELCRTLWGWAFNSPQSTDLKENRVLVRETSLVEARRTNTPSRLTGFLDRTVGGAQRPGG